MKLKRMHEPGQPDLVLIETGGADLAQLLSAAEAIGQALTGYTVVALRHAVPAGITEMVTAVLREATQQPFSVVAIDG